MKRQRTYRERLRGLLHAVLTTISRSVPVRQEDGSFATLPIEVWKEHFRRAFLGPDVSTEAISDSRLYTFILEVESDAATVLGVQFNDRAAP